MFLLKTLPAPIVTLSPILMGAIIVEFEPTKALEPINVLLVKICLKKNNKKYDYDSSCENGIKIIDSNNRTKFIKINVVQNVVTFLYYGKPLEMNNIAKFIEKVIESIMTNKKVGGKTRKRRFKS